LYELAILRDGEVSHRFSIGSSAVLVGRGPGNDIQPSDPSVSWQHAMFFVEAGRVWVRDLGSSNGTFIRDERIRGPQVLRHGDQVRLGAGTILVMRYLGDAPEYPIGGLVVLDEESGIAKPVLTDRFTIGSASDCELRVDGLAARAATLMSHANGEIWLCEDAEQRPLAIMERFTVAGRRFLLREVPGARDITVVPDPDRYHYKVLAWLEGPTGPEAKVEDLDSHRAYHCEVGNRAILLFLLSRKLREDRDRGATFNEAGWCSDDEVMSGVWGRHGDANKLHVLLHRLRADVKEAGLDPWFIEKKQRFVRIRVAEVEIAPVR
jgi:pSer/pThr/pTyr-binding forkhead associated (FHA) protein